MQLRSHGSPSDRYATSASEIEFKCPCHPGMIAGSARRTGVCAYDDYPVYRLDSFLHTELRGQIRKLVGVGLVDVKMVVLEPV